MSHSRAYYCNKLSNKRTTSKNNKLRYLLAATGQQKILYKINTSQHISQYPYECKSNIYMYINSVIK